MYIQTVLRSLALMAGAAFIFNASAPLQAAIIRSEKISIPFAFQVHKKSLPAGEYRVEQSLGSETATLVNLKTGEQVNFLRPSSTHENGKTKLTFESNNNGHSLKRIS